MIRQDIAPLSIADGEGTEVRPEVMEKRQLAQELRERQYKTGYVDRRVIDRLADADIIESYITCSQCHQRYVTPAEEAAALTMAANADQFLEMCERVAAQKHRHR